MKFLLSFITPLLVCVAVSVQAQDTARKQPTNPPAKTTTPAKSNEPAAPNPIINKIAVSDPGMPAEKPVNSSKNREAKRKKKTSTAAPK